MTERRKTDPVQRTLLVLAGIIMPMLFSGLLGMLLWTGNNMAQDIKDIRNAAIVMNERGIRNETRLEYLEQAERRRSR